MARHGAWRVTAIRVLVCAALTVGVGGGPASSTGRADAAAVWIPAAAVSNAEGGGEAAGGVWRLPATGGGDGGRVVDGVGGEPVGPDWQSTAVGVPVAQVRLSGGAVYVVSAEGGGAPAMLWRGEREGTEWRVLPAPVTRMADLTVHPQDDRVLYLAGEGGNYRSADAGQTWSTTLAAPGSQQGLRVVLSPVDPGLLYAATGLFSGATVWRSENGGANWTRLRDLSATLCTWTFPVVAPDPAARERLFLSYGCLAGRNTSATLTVSEDRWTTDGASLLVPSARNDDPLGYLYPQAVAFTPDRQRGVALAVRDQRLGGSALARTDNGGRTWRAVLNYAPSMGSAGPVGPNVVLGGLAVDGPELERLFVGLGRDGQGVLGSTDGGATWHRIGRGAVGAVRALALDSTAGVLYAGSERGLWRLPGAGSIAALAPEQG